MASKSSARDYGGGGGLEPLLPPSTSFYNEGERRYQDKGWTFAWITFYAATIAGGVYGVIHRNTDFLQVIAPSHLSDPTSCPAPGGPSRRLASVRGDPIKLDDFLRVAAAWIGAAVVLALLLGVGFLFLVKQSSRALVLTAIGLQVALPLVAGGAMLATGAWPGTVSMWALAALLAVTFFLWWEQIGLVTRLLGVAGHALIENAGLVGVAIGLQLAMLLVGAPLVLGLLASVMNGDVATNPARARDHDGQCFNGRGEPVQCCVWEVDPWVPGYASLVGLTMLWTTFLVFEIKVFVVSGAVAQWYFAQVSQLPLAPSGRGRSRTLRSLGHALGPSFGTLCCGSAILTLVQLARQALEKLREEQERNIFFTCAYLCLRFFYAVIEFVTKFATVQCAITGQAFFDGSRSVVGLLKRNFLDAFGVWWLPPMVLQSCALVVSLAFSMAISVSGWLAWGGAKGHGGGGGAGQDPKQMATTYAALLGVMAFLVSWAVLGFVTSLLLNVIDAVFVCFALDRDAHTCTKVEVHEVYGQLPTVHAVIEQPDGGYAYAAPQVVQAGRPGAGPPAGSAQGVQRV